MSDHPFLSVSPCDLADALPRSQFMNFSIRPLWGPMPRIAGPAFTVKCEPGDHLMLHAAIYRAAPGDVLVVEADADFAVAGGNVCAIAKSRGISGLVVDGCIRDIAETRDNRFPVFAQGVIPKPGAKKRLSPLNQPVTVGGVMVNAGDIIVADEEGVAVVPQAQASSALAIAQTRNRTDANTPLDEWQRNHQQKVESILQDLGYSDATVSE